MTGLTFESLAALWDELNRRPHPVAIWFVDREGDYVRVKAILQQAGLVLREAYEFGNLSGLSVVHWLTRNNARLMQAEREVLPWFISMPGIWVLMSDGNHAMLKLDDDQGA